jgi:hypothetical protein
MIDWRAHASVLVLYIRILHCNNTSIPRSLFFMAWSRISCLSSPFTVKGALVLIHRFINAPPLSSGSRLRLAPSPFISSRLAPPPTSQSPSCSHNGHSFLQYCLVCQKDGVYGFNWPIVFSVLHAKYSSSEQIFSPHAVSVKISISTSSPFAFTCPQERI